MVLVQRFLEHNELLINDTVVLLKMLPQILKGKVFAGKNVSFGCLQGRCTCVGSLGHQSLSESMNFPEKQVDDYNLKSIVAFMTPRSELNLSFS